jgi:hypothetical protein
VIRYARPSDYAHGAAAAAAGPALLFAMERFAPSYAGKGGFAQAMRVTSIMGIMGGFLYYYQRSIRTSSRLPVTSSHSQHPHPITPLDEPEI